VYSRKLASTILVVAAAGVLGCGAAQADDVTPQIIGGGAASEPYSWMTALNFTSPSGAGSGYTCGGTLIFRGWVVTAAHCVADPPPGLTVSELRDLAVRYGMDPEFYSHTPSEGDFWVSVGSHDRTSGGEPAEVTEVVVHPEFEWFAGAPAVTANDIAMLRLDHLLDSQPIRLAGSAATNGDEVRMLGWGSTEPGTQPGTTDPKPRMLQELDTTITADGLCGGEGGLSAKEICVSNVFGTDGRCFGDSGSPTVTNADVDGDGEVADDRKLVGIVSRGRIPCGTSASIDTSAPELRNFIYGAARGEFSAPPVIPQPRKPAPTYTLPVETPQPRPAR
jgi:secreted trypsin-like serine protease